MSSSENIFHRPNFIIFMPDQLSYSCVGTFGNTVIRTPNIDKLASQGVKFTNCYLQNSVCSQSRASIVTGKYPHVTGHRGLTTLLQPWEDNFFKTLKNNGYFIVSIGERGDLFGANASELSLNEYGNIIEPDADFFANMIAQFKQIQNFATNDNKHKVDWGRLYYLGERKKDSSLKDPPVDFDEAVIQSAEIWLDKLNSNPDLTGGKPWVLFLPLIFPHCPFYVEEPYYSLYDRHAIPKPLRVSEKTGYEPKYMSRLRFKHGLNNLPDEVWAEVGAVYYGMISRIDDQLGRILNKIEQYEPINSSTIKIFCTDHGEYLGNHELIEKWPSGVSEQLVHEPLIIAGPAISQNTTVDSLCEMVDLAPTLFQFAGLDEYPYPHNGKSLVPLLTGSSNQKHKEFVFTEGGFLKSEEPIIEFASYPYDIKAGLQHEELVTVGRVVSCRNAQYNFVYRLYEGKNELYDRKKDLQEAHNLIDEPEYQDLVTFFKDKILEWFFKTSDHAPFHTDKRRETVNLPKPGEVFSR
ncbi:related to choline-sulfatase [Saccharomycodes ludwigii]|uniref:Related to choline-sulfatase n=1 Tax=Saccharomycodes ludwigii TaxID=36035 RepID=A0A376B583_9ASCO|nr:related to choline-sulfatase [Saccharomycodes ludwigii]